MASYQNWYEERGYFKGNPLRPTKPGEEVDLTESEILPLGLAFGGAVHREVEIGRLSGIHEDVLSSSQLVNSNRMMNMLLAGGKSPSGEKIPGLLLRLGEAPIDEFRVAELTSGDRSYIMLQARIRSYPDHPHHNFRVKCDHCNVTYEWSQDLREVNCYGVPEEHAGRTEWEMVLPDSKKVVVYKVLIGKDEVRLSNLQKKYGPAGKDKGLASGFLTELMRLQIESLDKDPKVTSQALRSLSAWDRTFFRNEAERIVGGIQSSLEACCPSCNGETQVDLPINKDFFFPAWI